MIHEKYLQKIIEIIRENGEITPRQLSRAIKVHHATAHVMLSDLADLAYLKKTLTITKKRYVRRKYVKGEKFHIFEG